jgi:hypothetical protein
LQTSGGNVVITIFRQFSVKKKLAFFLKAAVSIQVLHKLHTYVSQGCQMVCFQTKSRHLGKFWRVLPWKILVYIMTIWSILRPLEIFYGDLVYFVVIWYLFPHFGILDQEKFGNPDVSLFVTKTPIFRQILITVLTDLWFFKIKVALGLYLPTAIDVGS